MQRASIACTDRVYLGPMTSLDIVKDLAVVGTTVMYTSWPALSTALRETRYPVIGCSGGADYVIVATAAAVWVTEPYRGSAGPGWLRHRGRAGLAVSVPSGWGNPHRS